MKYIVSACLLGENCKYSGGNNFNKSVVEYLRDKTYISICPEELGGLSTPRDPAEIIGDRVMTESGEDLTEEFERGAQESLDICQSEDVKVAILKSRSPSCGKDKIYDGSFSKKLIGGRGLTADLFIKNGIEVYTEQEIEGLIKIEEE